MLHMPPKTSPKCVLSAPLQPERSSASKSSAVNLGAIKSRTVFKRVGATKARTAINARPAETGSRREVPPHQRLQLLELQRDQCDQLVVSTQHQNVVHSTTNACANCYGGGQRYDELTQA